MLDKVIKEIEECNARSGTFNKASKINELLISIGGEPICVNSSAPNACDGSSISEIQMYMSLLCVRKESERVKKLEALLGRTLLYLEDVHGGNWVNDDLLTLENITRDYKDVNNNAATVEVS